MAGDQEMKTIYHYGGWGRNYGDLAIQAGMIHTLQDMASRQGQIIEFIPIDLKQNSPLYPDLIDLINYQGDMLLVGGGGLLMPGDGFNTRSGWQFNIAKDDLHRLKVPLVIYGIGYNLFPGDEQVLDGNVLAHIWKTREISKLFSVRDEGTKEWLNEHGIEDVDVIPDPAMFCPRYLPNSDLQSKLCVGLNWAGDRMAQRFPPSGDDKHVIEKVSDILIEFLEMQGGGRVVYIPHVGKYDWQGANLFEHYLDDSFCNIAEEIPYLFPESLAQVPLIVGIYSMMDVVVGMRGHSNIIPYSQGVPTIGFGNHLKNQFFAKSIKGITIGNDCEGLAEALAQSMLKRPPPSMHKEGAVIENFNRRVLDVLHNT